MFTYIFGWFASIITMTYKIPQMIELYKKKNTDGLSIYSYIIQSIGYILYLLHGFFNKDYPILVMGFISFIENIIVIILYFCYKE